MTLEREFADSPAFRICFVCTGNICRSPMAEAVFLRLARERGVTDRLKVASAGIGDYHVGEQADPRTVRALEAHGYPASDHRAKQFKGRWLEVFDLVIALDRGQERALKAQARTDEQEQKVKLLMSFDADAATLDVPDPYYSEEAFFTDVLMQIESACNRLFRQIEPAVRVTP